MKCSLFLLFLVSTLSAYTTIDLGDRTCTDGIFTDATPSHGGRVVGGGLIGIFPPEWDPGIGILPPPYYEHFYEITAIPYDGYVFSHWLQDGNQIIGGPTLFITYTMDPSAICILDAIFPVATFSAVFNQAPVLDLETFYESNSGESITIDATPTDGYPTNYTYQWFFKPVGINIYFVISTTVGGSASTFQILGNSDNNGTWRVEVTNEAGTTTAEFNYRVYADSDNDGLSDGQEEFVLGTDPSLTDTDGDGLGDGTEVNTYTTNPLAADTTGDGFSDGFLVSEGFIPTSDYNALRTETVNQIQDARVGSTMIEVSDGKADITMTLEETSNLSDWSSGTTSEKTIEVDAPAGTRFYRFKMTE
tara:strand:- start:71 stop:1156 length:1086 start_codon:yes stop_codon:yes gene_type:complete